MVKYSYQIWVSPSQSATETQMNALAADGWEPYCQKTPTDNEGTVTFIVFFRRANNT